MTEIGDRVRAIREAQGKSEAAIAGLAGLDKGFYHRLETGERALDRIPHIIAIAKALRVSPADLMGLHVPPPNDSGIDETESRVREAILAVSTGHAEGLVLPVTATVAGSATPAQGATFR